MSLNRVIATAALAAFALSATYQRSLAATTGYEPDAWTRGNTVDSSYFGWDVIERAGLPTLDFGRILDDSTPDLGTGITATGTRIYQGANGIVDPSPTLYGHVSGSMNYYSGANFADPTAPQIHFANDTITATTPASGAGGFTTVVLQVLAQPANGIEDLNFEMTTAGWTKQKDLYGILAGPTGVIWQEWTAPGADLPFSIHMTSPTDSRAIDSFAVDTFWTSGAAPVINARASVGIPEPAAGALACLAVLALAARRRCA